MKIEKIVKLLSSKDPKDHAKGIAELKADHINNINALLTALPALKGIMGTRDITAKDGALDIMLAITRARPQALSDSLQLLGTNLDLTVRRDQAYLNNLQIASKSAQIIKDVCTANPRAANPNLLIMAMRTLQPPFYNPGVAIRGSDKLTLESLSLLGTFAGVNPQLMSNPGVVPTVWKVYQDSFKFQRFQVSGNRKGSMRWWAGYILSQSAKAYPQNTLPVLIKGLASREQEVATGAAQLIVQAIPNPKALNLLFNYIKSPDQQLVQYSTAAIAIVVQSNPPVFIPALSGYLTAQGAGTGVQQISLTVIGNVGLHGGQVVLNTLPTIVHFFKDQRPELRGAAIIAVGKLGASNPELIKNAVPHIIALLRDPDPRVKRASVETLNLISKTRPDLVKAAIPLLFENLAEAENRWLVGEVLLRFGININEYQKALDYLQRVWGEVSNLMRLGVDTSTVDPGLTQAREAIKVYQYPRAIELARQAERTLAELKSTSRPIIDLEITFEKEPCTARWVVMDLNLINKGTAMARDLMIESPMFVNTQDLHIIGRLEAGKNILMTIRWLPHLSGRVPLNLFIKYTDPFGNEDTVVKTYDVEIKEPAAISPDSPYMAGGYAHDHHEEASSYAMPEVDSGGYAQTEVAHMKQEPHQVDVEEFHDKFEVDRSHTEGGLDQPEEEEEGAGAEDKKEKSGFDIDDIISELMSKSQKPNEEADRADDGTGPGVKEDAAAGEVHHLVKPSRILMPKKPVEGQAVEEKPAEDRPGEEKPAEDQTVEEQPPPEQPLEEKPEKEQGEN